MANIDYRLEGTILCIDKTRPSREGSNLMLRDFFLTTSMGGETNDIKCQLKGNNCALLDNYIPGDEVIVRFALLGGFGGAKTKEGHPRCNTNQNGLTAFTPNVNVFCIQMEDGFKRSEHSANNVSSRIPDWAAASANVAVGGTNQSSGSPAGDVDDFPF
jgi:hypothetical protein